MMTLEKLKDEVNHGIFDNHQDNEIHQKDVFDFLKTVQGDVVYFDPPYPGSSAYEVEYGILDNLLVGKKLDNKASDFSHKDADEFLERLFASATHIPQWVISLGQNKEDIGVKPDKLLAMVQKHRKAEVQMMDHKWSVANAGGRNQSNNIEYMIVTV